LSLGAGPSVGAILTDVPRDVVAGGTYSLTRTEEFIKRSIDFVGAALGLLVLAPLVLVVVIAVRIDSPGPALFRQTRVGRGGRPFRMIKFRTMVDGAHELRAALSASNETIGIFKITHDPRVTRVGRLLRRTSLDELPQLLNVLCGEMSLVGPRPLIPEEDRLIEGRYRERLGLRPGLTGPWQIVRCPRPPLAEMVEVDCRYAASWSVWMDVRILLMTFLHAVRRWGV
jgi:lipopolysaccharide/colanic/teichoic acid biosynthesis glycosyltransferase